ncbi:MAG: calcium/sodium antiporter [Actinomycetia bacterium]|nr:calcium/sodium antiporter [Actinomycetes bacterium]
MSPLVVVLVVGGLILLVVGGEVLVRGASDIAHRIGMSRLVVGLTVVSFATSAPELAVTMDAVFSGSPGLAIGNVVGSNIANILLVLGVAAAIAPLAVRSRVVKLDVPVMIALSILVTIFALNGVIATWQGVVLLLALVGYVIRAVQVGRRDTALETKALAPQWAAPQSPATGEIDPPATERPQDGAAAAVTSGQETEPEPDAPAAKGAWPVIRALALIVVGVALLVVGARLLVNGATQIATGFGVSDVIVGLTVVAIGTSLPELATSVVAVLRGESDLAVGNAVGSNIFNLAFVLGTAALVAPGGIPVPESVANFDFVLMTVVAVLLLPVAYTRKSIDRWEGWLFLGYYLAYTSYLLLASADHDALGPFNVVMIAFVVPVTVILLITLAVAERKDRRVRRAARAKARSG